MPDVTRTTTTTEKTVVATPSGEVRLLVESLDHGNKRVTLEVAPGASPVPGSGPHPFASLALSPEAVTHLFEALRPHIIPGSQG